MIVFCSIVPSSGVAVIVGDWYLMFTSIPVSRGARAVYPLRSTRTPGGGISVRRSSGL